MSGRVVIVGGGLAGGAAACLLARAGHEVLLLERTIGPAPKICGEFVSGEAADYLRRLGLDLTAIGAHPIGGLRLIRGRTVVETALPFAGFGLSRHVLDEALLAHAAAHGAEIRRGRSVSQVRITGDRIVLEAGDEEIRAETLFLATGKHDLRGVRRQVRKAPDELVGFKLHFRLAPAQLRAIERHVEVMLFPDGYGGLQPVENGAANLCLLIGAPRLRRVGGGWTALLAELRRAEPHLDARLAGGVALEPHPVSIYRVPYGFVHRGRDDPPNLFRLGDQAGVIPSFTGEGMAIALHSATVATGVFLGNRDAAEYHRRIRDDITGQIGRASLLYRGARGALGQSLLMRLAAAFPTGLAMAAAATCIPPRALRAAEARLDHNTNTTFSSGKSIS